MFRLTFPAAMFVAGAAFAEGGDLRIAMLLPGDITDNGFMEAGYDGLQKIRDQFGAEIDYIDRVKPEKALLEQALRKLAASRPDMIIAHGGQNGEAARAVAPEFPGIAFVVVQGNVTGPNLSSYEVLQEESAWLAGAAAGLLTKSGIIGHISGIRVPPGLKGRGGFYNGLMHTRPDAQFLTVFAGDQDDPRLAARAARAELDRGADIIFTMLNAGRQGVTETMRDSGARQIGNVTDWTRVEPGVFVASAMADVGIPGLQAVEDFTKGNWKPGVVRAIGLENPDAVSLALSGDVPEDVRAKMDELREAIVTDKIGVSTEYNGPEFEI